MPNEARYKSVLLKIAYWGAIIGIALLFIRYLLGPLTPFIIAFAIAAILQPLVRGLSKLLKTKRSIVAVVLVVLTYLLLAGALVLLVVGAVSAIIDWASGLPELFTGTISPWITEKMGEFMALMARLDPDWNASVNSLLGDAVSSLGGSVMDFSVNLASWASSVGTKLPGIMLALVICIIATVFIAGDFDKLKSVVYNALPLRLRELFKPVQDAFRSIVGNYAKSYALILLMTFAEISVGLLIIGVENALFIALVIAFFDILPVVGSGMVLLPWTIVKLIQGDIRVGVGLGILYVVVIVVRQVAEPRIVGKTVGMHPLATLLCMWIGLQLFGGVGMFALPVTVLMLKDLKEDGIIFGKTPPPPSADSEQPEAPEAPQATEAPETLEPRKCRARALLLPPVPTPRPAPRVPRRAMALLLPPVPTTRTPRPASPVGQWLCSCRPFPPRAPRPASPVGQGLCSCRAPPHLTERFATLFN